MNIAGLVPRTTLLHFPQERSNLAAYWISVL
jgi:hypothetical protein